MLAHWSNSPRVDISLHSYIIPILSYSVLLLLNTACLVEKQQISILKSLDWSEEGSNPRSTALKAMTIAIKSRFMNW